MRYTVSIGTYFGIPLRVHFTFPLILVVFGAQAWIGGDWRDAAWAVLLVLVIFMCVVLHEFGHSLQVRRYGIAVRDIVLLPIGGVARAERIPERPRHEIVVAISGPLVNFALAGIFLAAIWIRGRPIDLENDFLSSLLAINLVLGTFNLIPAFPMDGGRILRGILAVRFPYLTATRYARAVGQIIALVFIVVGFVDHSFIMLPLIAVFIYFGAISEENMVRVRVMLEGKRVGDFVPTDQRTVRVDGSIEGAFAMIDSSTRAARRPGGRGFQAVLVATDAAGTALGLVSANDIVAAVQDGQGAEPVSRIVRCDFPVLSADTPAVQAYHLLRAERLPYAGVLDGGRLVGLVFTETMLGIPR